MSVVERVIGALNAHELDEFVSCYSPVATIEDGHGAVLARAHDGLRERYGPMFAAHPLARWEVLTRIEAGPFVVQHEQVTGRGDPSRHVCVYLVQDDVIVREQVLA